jgi:hypothetical protein
MVAECCSPAVGVVCGREAVVGVDGMAGKNDLCVAWGGVLNHTVIGMYSFETKHQLHEPVSSAWHWVTSFQEPVDVHASVVARRCNCSPSAMYACEARQRRAEQALSIESVQHVSAPSVLDY